MTMNEIVEIFSTPMPFYVLTVLLGLCVGSFLNVAIWRIPHMLKQEWTEQCCELFNKTPAETSKFNLFLPRSHCPHCKHLIPLWHNIPILSYLMLKGQCAVCQKKISLRYPLIELLTASLSVIVSIHFGFGMMTLAGLVFVWFLITLCFIDIDHQLLPDNLTLSLLWIGLLFNSQGLIVSLHNAVVSAFCAYVFLWLFVKLFYLVTGKIGMGHGDFKLFAALGAWLGWQQLPLILILSALSGLVIGGLSLLMSNEGKDTPIPFGPYLCVAGFISFLYGKDLVDWYLSALL